MNKKELIKSIKKEKKELLYDCWDYHKDLFKDTNIKKKDVINNTLFNTIELSKWEDIGYYIGYTKALDDIIIQLEKLN